MDSNDPNNSNSTFAGGTPLPSLDPSSAPPAQAFAPTGQPQEPAGQIIADIPQTSPGQAVPPPGTPGSPWGPPQTTPPPAPTSPWETSAPSMTPETVAAPADAPGFMPQSDASTTSAPSSVSPSDVPTAPAAPASPETSNPFLQPQTTTNFSVPQTSFDQMPVASTPPVAQAAETLPNPMATSAPDPLNTAFSPTGASEQNPFGQFQTPQAVGATVTTGPATPPTSPWETQSPSTLEMPGMPQSAEASAPAPENFAATPAFGSGQPGETIPPQQPMQDSSAAPVANSGTLDLSSLQNPQPTGTEANPQPGEQPGSETINQQGNSPTENAPTDLSHLIAGDESASQAPGNVYTPPVAQDQTPGVPVPQTPATDGAGAAPPEKHLNLTKVLLVAGIPIILIVAALSAYLILGVGKAAPEEDTSLPVEQTQQTQAPLTNPPQQIVAPSPATIPEPGTSGALPTDSTALPALPESSPSPSPSTAGSAMERLKARQSPSPASSASTDTTSSESLPQ